MAVEQSVALGIVRVATVGSPVCVTTGRSGLRWTGSYWTCTDVLAGLTRLGAVSGPDGPARP